MDSLKKGLVLCMLTGFFLFSWFGRFQPVSFDKQVPEEIQAEIKGHVLQEGVYTLPYGSSLEDLIQKAGGLLEGADTSSVSLMTVLSDGSLVVIPEKGEEPETIKISLNTASEHELQSLPGIGQAIAARIVEYRQTTSFTSLEQIMEVKGIGEKMFEKIREQICL